MQHDLQLRAVARAIYENVYPLAHPGRATFDEAERFTTEHYRQAIGAAQDARSILVARHEQLLFAAIL